MESDKINITASEKYEAKVMTYISSGRTMIYLRFYTSENVLINSVATGTSTPTGQWTQMSVSGIAPTTSAKMAVLLYSSSPAITTAYFDHVDVNRLVINSSYEDGTIFPISGWAQKYGTTGISVSNEQKKTGTYSLKIVDTDSAESFGMESDKMSITAGQSYTARAMTYIESGSAFIYLRYYSSTGTLISSFFNYKSTPVGQWDEISVVGVAPSNATQVAILLYSSFAGVGTAYYDDVSLNTSFVSLGKPIYNSIFHDAKFAKNLSNSDVVYTVMSGNSAVLTEIDLATNKENQTIKFPVGSYPQGSWAMETSTNGDIFIGSYPDGHLYKYTLGGTTITDLGKPFTSTTFIFDLTSDSNGNIYGGTYPDCLAFKYDPSTGIFTDVGNGSLVTGEDYVRSVAYEPITNSLYCGIGTQTARLIKINLNNGTKTEIESTHFNSESVVYNLELRNNRLFARVTPANKSVVINTSTDTFVKDIDDRGLDISAISPHNSNMIYFRSNANKIWTYDTSTDVVTNTNVSIGASGTCELGFQQQGNDHILIIYGASRDLFRYNLDTLSSSLVSCTTSGSPINLTSVYAGPDGKIYSGGYQSGGMGIYNPSTGQRQQYLNILQSEGITNIGNDMYFGTYPGGVIYKDDTTGAWSPTKIFDLSSNHQDRPFGMLGVSAESKLFIGTVSDYGLLGGALSVYNLSGSPSVYQNVIADQSIVSLAYKNGEVFGGTSVWGGLGIDPTQTEAKLFVWNVSSNQKVFETVPIAGKKCISTLITASDGNIWGIADGYLFLFSPTTRMVTYTQLLYNITYTNSVWHDADLVDGGDGYIYGVVNGKLFKINISSKTFTELKSSGCYRLAKGSSNDLYYCNGAELFKYLK